MQVSENRPQNGVFSENSRLIVSAWKDENGGFRMRWCHTCYRISIVLVFQFCVKKGERFEYAICLAETQKISVFKNTGGRGLNMSPIAKDLQLFCATFLPVLFLLLLLTFF